jgi:two-component system nitrogen regulation response regulator GlnG
MLRYYSKGMVTETLTALIAREGAMPKILVVDDQDDMRWLLSRLLQEQGFEVSTADDGVRALSWVQQETPQAILLDLKMPQLDGLQALASLKELAPEVPVIVITAYGDVRSAVQAMKLGAYDFITKPFDNDELLYTVKRAVERRELLGQVAALQNQLTHQSALGQVMGTSPPMQAIFAQIQQVAGSNFTVIIEGETGTGKELAARAIYQQSLRSKAPFIALDCGAIPETLIESELFGYEKGAFTGADRRKTGHMELAAGGTLFLDEITNLPLTTQSKLLRALQERQIQPLGAMRPLPVDLRVIAASNVRLAEEVQSGRFRQDLFHRLNEFLIRLPPLRERPEDIRHLAQRFLAEANLELRKNVRGMTPAAVAMLESYAWPGNVRELRNVIRRATLLSVERIGPEHLVGLGSTAETAAVPTGGAEGLGPGSSLKLLLQQTVAQVEREAIERVLRQTRGNKSQAARLLQIDYKTLYAKLKAYSIDAIAFRR